MYNHSCRFIDHEQVFIFINNIQGNIFRMNLCVAWRLRQRYGYNIIWPNLIIRLCSLVIYLNKATMESILDFCTSYVGQPVHEEFVDPDKGLASISGYSVMFKELIILLIIR